MVVGGLIDGFVDGWIMDGWMMGWRWLGGGLGLWIGTFLCFRGGGFLSEVGGRGGVLCGLFVHRVSLGVGEWSVAGRTLISGGRNEVFIWLLIGYV